MHKSIFLIAIVQNFLIHPTKPKKHTSSHLYLIHQNYIQNKVLRRALDAANIPDTTREGFPITPKTLRATHDTILIQKGISLDYIARTSGHTVEIIHKYYHSLLDEVSNKEANKVKSIWG